MEDDFKKRVYVLDNFFHDILSLGRNIFDLIDTICSRRINKAFREKLNMAVTSVLGCRYCSWLHTEMALSQGVEGKDLQNILSQELGDFPEKEAVALAFAQHYSETNGRPQKDAEMRFYEYYGRKMAKDILFYIQMMYIGNLSGNTIDALLNRVKGHPVEGSNLCGELVIFSVLGPYFLIILPILAFAVRRKRP